MRNARNAFSLAQVINKISRIIPASRMMNDMVCFDEGLKIIGIGIWELGIGNWIWILVY
jgi:hypothetical protein